MTSVTFEQREAVHGLLARIEKDPDGSFFLRVPYRRISQTWLVTSLDATWLAALRIVPRRGEPVVAELRVFPNHPDRKGLSAGEWAAELLDEADIERSGLSNLLPDGGLSARVLREVKIGALREQYGRIISHWEHRHGGISIAGPYSWTPPTASSLREPRRGMPRKPDAEYAQIAALYVKALEDGSTTPNLDTARELSRSWGYSVTSKQVTAWLLAARRRGLLERPSRGRGYSGGRLTPEGLAALAEAKQDPGADHGEH